MGSVEERLSSLEARVDAHAVGLNDLRQAVVHLEQRMDRRFEAVDARFSALDGTLAARFDAIDTKIGHLTSIVVWALAAILAAVSSLAAVLLR